MSTFETIVDDVGEAGKIVLDVSGIIAGIFPGAASVINIIKLIADVAATAPAVYSTVESSSSVITKLANSALIVMNASKSTTPIDPKILKQHVDYINAAQEAFAQGLPENIAKLQYPELNTP